MGSYTYILRGPSRAKDIEIDGRVVRAGIAQYDHKPFTHWGAKPPRGYEARVERVRKAWDNEAPEFVILVGKDGKVTEGSTVYALKHGLFSWDDDACHGHPDRMPQVGTVRELRRGKPARVGTKRFDVTFPVRDYKPREDNPAILTPTSDVYERTERVFARDRSDAIEAALAYVRRWRSPVPEYGTGWDAKPVEEAA